MDNISTNSKRVDLYCLSGKKSQGNNLDNACEGKELAAGLFKGHFCKDSTEVSRRAALQIWVIRSFDLDDLLNCLFVRFSRFDSFHISPKLRMFFFGESSSPLGSPEWEAHHDVGSCQLAATEVLSTIRRACDLALEKFKMSLEIRFEEHGGDIIGDGIGDWFYEKRRVGLDAWEKDSALAMNIGALGLTGHE